MNQSEEPDPKGQTKGVAPLGPVNPPEQEEAAKYWTDERMRGALPVPLPSPPEEPKEGKGSSRQGD